MERERTVYLAIDMGNGFAEGPILELSKDFVEWLEENVDGYAEFHEGNTQEDEFASELALFLDIYLHKVRG